MRQLAANDLIDVAGPALARANCLTDETLAEIAESKSQSHLSKIAERHQLSPTITDILVDRGDHDVVKKVAANSGARFSNTGMSPTPRHASRWRRSTDRNDFAPHRYSIADLLPAAELRDPSNAQTAIGGAPDEFGSRQPGAGPDPPIPGLAAMAKHGTRRKASCTPSPGYGIDPDARAEFADGGKITNSLPPVGLERHRTDSSAGRSATKMFSAS